MVYTVKKLASISGISIRTLRFYDEIGLLKPAYYGDNHYRYYGEAELLMLQQILFFRELGFQLADIREIISSPDFDKIKTLESHRKILEKNIEQTKKLLETIDKTISHLRGNETMKLEEVFHGFNAEKQKLYEDFLVDNGINQESINQTKEKIKDWKKDQWLAFKEEGDKIHADLVTAIKKQQEPSSPEVQKIIKKHYQLTTNFWIPTKETYIGLGGLYSSHPDFVKFYNDIHPELLNYLITAMGIFANTELV